MKFVSLHCFLLHAVKIVFAEDTFDQIYHWKQNIINKSWQNQICLAQNIQDYCNEYSDNQTKTVSDDFANGEVLECRFILEKSENHLKVCHGKHVASIEIIKTGNKWTFDTRIESALVFRDQARDLVILDIDGSIFSYASHGHTGQYFQANLTSIRFDTEFLIPEFTVVEGEAVYDTSSKLDTVQENFWYTEARLAVNDSRIVEQNKKKRKLAQQKLSSLVNWVKRRTDGYGNQSSDLTCSAIFKTSPDPSLPRNVFVAYPGSGNSWIRLILELGSGLGTCFGFTEKHEDGGCLLTFSHHFGSDFQHSLLGMEADSPSNVNHRFSNLAYFNGRGILLIRNPFKALVSYFRHRIMGFHSDSEISTTGSRAKRPDNIGVFYTPEFEVFAYNHVEKWRLVVEDWVTAGDVHVVHFENVLEDKIGEVVKMLTFLNLKLDERRLDCLRKAEVDIFKRSSSKLRHSPYSAALARTIQANIDHVNDLLVKHGHPGIPYNKYGQEKVFTGINVEWEGSVSGMFGPSLYTDHTGGFTFGVQK